LDSRLGWEIRVRIGIAAMLVLLASPAPALAQADEIDRRVAERLEVAKQIYGVPDPRLRCRPGSDGEIVVCADRGEDLKIDRDPPDPNTLEGRRELSGGIPRAPQLDRGSCKGQFGCITGGWVPSPVYYIDVTALPEAPEGSDADKIAKGEMPAP
jgi:hypothetical protein